MIVYTFGIFITMTLGYLYSEYKKHFKCKIAVRTFENKKKYINVDFYKFIPMVPLAVIAGIRYDVGQDYMYTYVPIFEKVLKGNINEAWGEKGYIYLNKFVTLFTDDYAGIFILSSIIFVFFVFISIYEESDNISLSVMLLVCTGYYFCFLNGLRQMLAVSIILFSIKYIQNRNIVKFILCMVIAVMIHYSVLVFAPMYFVFNKKWTNFKMVIAIIIAFILSSFISDLLIKIIAHTKYSWYLDSIYKAERKGIIMILINIVILIFAMIFNKNEKNEIYIKLQFLAVITTAFIGKIPIAHRLLWNFGLPSIILIPNVIACQKSKRTRIISNILLFVVYMIYFFYTIGIKNSNNVLPYKTIMNR